MAGTSHRDPFDIDISFRNDMAGHADGFSASVELTYQGQPFGAFQIDVEAKLSFLSVVEVKEVRPIALVPGVIPLSSVRLYPLEDQVADKVAAMYQRYRGGQRASTRYRDLIDLALLASTPDLKMDLPMAREALRRQVSLRGIAQLPASFVAPADGWKVGYEKATTKYPYLPPNVGTFEQALKTVNAAFGDLLHPAEISPDGQTAGRGRALGE